MRWLTILTGLLSLSTVALDAKAAAREAAISVEVYPYGGYYYYPYYCPPGAYYGPGQYRRGHSFQFYFGPGSPGYYYGPYYMDPRCYYWGPAYRSSHRYRR